MNSSMAMHFDLLFRFFPPLSKMDLTAMHDVLDLDGIRPCWRGCTTKNVILIRTFTELYIPDSSFFQFIQFSIDHWFSYLLHDVCVSKVIMSVGFLVNY